MPFKIKFSKDLTLDIRDSPHLLIVGKGNNKSAFAEQIKDEISRLYDRNKRISGEFVNHDWWTDNYYENKRFYEVLEERYSLLSALNFTNIKQYNAKFKHEDWIYRIILADPSILNHETAMHVLMKGRAVGMHIIMFASNVTKLTQHRDLLDLFPIKLVYKTRNVDESILLTGKAGAEKLKNNEFMLCELGKQPVIYKNR